MTRRRIAWVTLLLVVALTIRALNLLAARDGSVVPPGLTAPPATAPVTAPGTPIALPTPSTPPTRLERGLPARAVDLAADHDGPMALSGPPSVSPALIDATLTREDSPLAGFGRVIWAEGYRWDVDPVFLLAVVSYIDLRDPLPAAAHNVGHLRAVGGGPARDGYQVFPTWQAGIAAWYRLIHDLYIGRWRLRTLDGMLPVYAPSSPNGVEAALATLRAMVTAWRAAAIAPGSR